jgi:hypothetical protein
MYITTNNCTYMPANVYLPTPYCTNVKKALIMNVQLLYFKQEYI